MSFLSNMFGSEKVIGGLIDTADNMWETTEEKSKAKMMFLKLYEPFKLAQRFALIIFGVTFVSIHCIVAGFWIYFTVTATNGELFDFRVTQLKEIAMMNNSTLGDPVSWILAFYFLGGAGEGMIKAWSSKLAKK